MARDGEELTQGAGAREETDGEQSLGAGGESKSVAGQKPDAGAEEKPGSAGAEKPAVPQSIWVLVAAAFIIALGYGLIAPVLPQFAQSFNVGVAAAGAVVSIFAFSRLAFAPVSGRLVDRLGSRRVYLSGLLIVALTTGLVAFVGEYWHILLLRAVAGVGSTMFTVSAMGLIVRLSPPEIRGRCSSLYATAFLLGNVLGPVLGAMLSVLGMRAPFAIYGAAVFLAAVVVWRRMPASVGVQQTEGGRPTTPMRFREAFADSAYRSALVGGFANGWLNFGVRVATLPLLAAAIFESGAAYAGLAMATFAAGNAVVQQFSGRAADRVGRKPLILVGLLANGAFTAALGFSDRVWSLLLLSVLAGAGAGLFNPAQQAVLADVIGAERSGGRVLANFQMAQDTGSILGPIIVGLLIQWAGFRAGFLACGVVAGLAVLAWCFGRETLRKPSSVSAL